METVYPICSDQLVALARCYDRAALANAAVGWCLSSKLDIDEDDYFTNWVRLYTHFNNRRKADKYVKKAE